MAFPIVETTNNGTTADGTSHTVNLPTGIVSGNLLLAMFSLSTPATATWPAGWTELYDTASAGTLMGSGAYRVADGGEGASITVTTSIGGEGSYNTYRISGQHASSAPEVGTSATGSSTTPDPPAVTPTWGSADTLWFAVMHHDFCTVTTAPTNYTNLLAQDGATPVTASARRALAAADENPGGFTVSAADAWVAQTCAVRPAEAGGATTKRLLTLGLGSVVPLWPAWWRYQRQRRRHAHHP